MDILDELAEKFAITLDFKLCSDSDYLKAIALLHLPVEETSNQHIQKLMSTVAHLITKVYNDNLASL